MKPIQVKFKERIFEANELTMFMLKNKHIGIKTAINETKKSALLLLKIEGVCASFSELKTIK